MSKSTLAIISSVPEWGFQSISLSDPRFYSPEIVSAHKDEKQVFIDAIGIPDLEKHIKIEVIRALDGIPANFSADAYILGGSPSMVTDRDKFEWIDRLHRFVESEVNSGKPLFGICFWHQILAGAFGWKVDFMKERVIGPGMIQKKDGEEIESFWSHKQAVYAPGDAKITAQSWDIIQMIQVWDHAFGTQFHPEFTPEFTSFLVKLMRSDIDAEWLNSSEILKSISHQNQNLSSELLRRFVKKYYNI